jgi:hypothetical protein
MMAGLINFEMKIQHSSWEEETYGPIHKLRRKIEPMSSKRSTKEVIYTKLSTQIKIQTECQVNT